MKTTRDLIPGDIFLHEGLSYFKNETDYLAFHDGSLNETEIADGSVVIPIKNIKAKTCYTV